MSDLFRSTGLVPVVGTIDWLTGRPRKKLFSAGLVPVESTICSAGGANSRSIMRSTGTSPARGEGWFGLRFSLSISARRGQAPDVAEQNRRHINCIAKPHSAHASPTLRINLRNGHA